MRFTRDIRGKSSTHVRRWPKHKSPKTTMAAKRMSQGIRKSLSRLTGQSKASPVDLSNEVVRYQSVSVRFLKEVLDGVLEENEASGVELYVCVKDSGHVKEGTTAKKIEDLKDGKKVKCEVPYVGQRDTRKSTLLKNQEQTGPLRTFANTSSCPLANEQTAFILT